MRVGVIVVASIKRLVHAVVDQPASRWFLIAAILALGIFSFELVITMLSHTLNFDGFAANGAFQLMNPLRRLAAGEAIGNDFSFFHGVGVPLIHLPFYYLFGQGLFGSEIARWLVSPALFMGSVFVFFYVLRRRFVFAFSMTALVTIVGMQVVPFLVLPLTSLLGVRSFVPVILMALMLKQAALRRPVSQKYTWTRKIDLYEVLVGLLLALGFLCGTEFGVAAVIGFVLANTLYRVDALPSWRARFYSTARILAASGVLLLALLTLITRGTPLEPIIFALKEIPADQFWYFGVPPNNFLHLGNVADTFTGDGKLLVMLLVAVIAAVLVFFVHRLKVYRDYTQAFIFGLLAGAFAMVSMLGYYNNSEASALTRMGLLVAVAAAVLLYDRWQRPLVLSVDGAKSKKRNLLTITRTTGLKLLGVLFLTGVLVYSIGTIRSVTHNYDVHAVLAKTKNFLLRRDTNLLGLEWRRVDAEVMPIIQSDNTVTVADINEQGFVHGVKTNQMVIDPGKYASFIRAGQIVYFAKSGRQIIHGVQAFGKTQLLVTLQNQRLVLDPAYDGSAAKLVVAEDFDHNNKQVWMLYSGLVDQEMGTFQPTADGYDYIIHALGKERRAQYVQEFKDTRPEYVLTLTRPYFRYEEWVQNAHWDFYSVLDENYEVVKQTSIYNVWKKRDQPWSGTHRQNQAWQPLTVHKTDKRIDLPALDFTNVPDLEAFGQAQQQAERDQARAVGKDVKDPISVSEEAYNLFKMQEVHGRRHYEQWRSENSGTETDAAEHLAWQQAADAKRNPFDVQPPDGEFHVDRPKRQVILVKLTYAVSHPLSQIPLVGKTTRYLVEPNNTYSRTQVSLKPYEHEIIFPLVISELNKGSYLRLATYSMLPGGGKLDIASAEWTLLDTPPANLQALTD
jgi:hypothetical protein